MRAATQDFCLPIRPLHLRLSLGLDHTQRAEASSLPWGLEDGLANSHPEGQPPRRPRPSPARDLESSREPIREPPATPGLEQPLPLSWTREAVVGRAHPEGDQGQTLAPRGGTMQQLQTADGMESFPRPSRPAKLSPTCMSKEKGKRKKMGFYLQLVTRAQLQKEFNPLVSWRPGL